MARDEAGYSSYHQVSFLLVSHGKNGKRGTGLLGTKGLIPEFVPDDAETGGEGIWSAHFPSEKNS